MDDLRKNERLGLFKGLDRLLLQCSECKHYFYLLKKSFDPAKPIICKSCGAKDTEKYSKNGPTENFCSIASFNQTRMMVARWREGFFRENQHFPGAFNLNASVQIPTYFFDYVLPHLRRFETLVFFMLKKFESSRSGWITIAQTTLAQRLSQLPFSNNADKNQIHTPSRQAVGQAIRGLQCTHIIIHWKSKEHDSQLLESEVWEGRSLRYKLNLNLPPGSTILRVERWD